MSFNLLDMKRDVEGKKITKRLLPTAWLLPHPFPLHNITVQLISGPFAYPNEGSNTVHLNVFDSRYSSYLAIHRVNPKVFKQIIRSYRT